MSAVMEGTNAVGKRVSLLCDEAGAPPAKSSGAGAAAARLPYYPSTACARPGPRPIVHTKPSYSSRSSTSTTSSSSITSIPYHSDSDSSLSRHSSIASPRFSPAVRAVPHLQRHDSTSSAQSPNTPSPMTPTYPFEPLDPQGKSAINADPSTGFAFATHPSSTHNPAGLVPGTMSAASNAPFYPSSAQGALPISASQTNMFGGFPALQQAPFDDVYGAMPTPVAAPPQVQFQYPTDLIAPLAASSSLASPTSLAAVANPNAPLPPVDPSSVPGNNNNNSAAPTKPKKKYPCPHAAKFGCHDTFTTSGHAARHGKKHTGEKNILCPTCHKAFTRKDNMKQHERTHKNNRNNDSVDHGKPNGAASGNSRRTQSISSVAASTLTHKSSNSTEMELDSPLADPFDSKRNSMQRPSLGRPGQYAASSNAELKFDVLHQRPELNRQFSGESQDGEGESPGLDALAMAATSELR